MALFTDGQVNNLQDLERYESGLLNVTSVEQINVSTKMALAQDLIASEVLVFLLRLSSRDSTNFLFTFQTASIRRLVGLSDIVVTEPLKRWHALKSIELIYQDAYNNQLNDRYAGKRLQYQQLAIIARDQLLQVGVGAVSDPVRKATDPLLVAVDGTLQGTTYYVRTTWINRAGQEGAPSEVVGLQTIDGTQLVVPSPLASAKVVGWNVYAGMTPDGLSLQNAVPLPLQSDWTLPVTGLQFGRKPGDGQAPERYLVNDQVVQRG